MMVKDANTDDIFDFLLKKQGDVLTPDGEVYNFLTPHVREQQLDVDVFAPDGTSFLDFISGWFKFSLYKYNYKQLYI